MENTDNDVLNSDIIKILSKLNNNKKGYYLTDQCREFKLPIGNKYKKVKSINDFKVLSNDQIDIVNQYDCLHITFYVDTDLLKSIQSTKLLDVNDREKILLKINYTNYKFKKDDNSFFPIKTYCHTITFTLQDLLNMDISLNNILNDIYKLNSIICQNINIQRMISIPYKTLSIQMIKNLIKT